MVVNPMQNSLSVAPNITTPPMNVIITSPEVALFTCESDGLPAPTSYNMVEI